MSQDEPGLEPSEPDTEDDDPIRSGSDWPHLSDIDLEVCVEPTSLPGPPTADRDE